MNSPFQPALLFRTVSNAEFDLVSAAEGVENAAGTGSAFAGRGAGNFVGKNVVSTAHAQNDKEKNEEFSKRG